MGKIKILGILVVLVLFSFAAYAEEEKTNTQMLSSALANAKCEADFSTAVLDSIISNVPDAASEVSSFKTKISEDLSQLSSLAAAGKSEDYKAYVKSNFDPDIKAAREGIKNAKVGTKVTRGSGGLLKIKEDFDAAKSAFTDCHFNAMKQFADLKANAYTAILDNEASKLERFKETGIDTISLSLIIEDARSQIVVPLQDRIQTSTDGESLRSAVGSYCLYDGCKEGINFHLQARLDLERLGVILAYLKQRFSLADDITDPIKSKLDTVGISLVGIGNARYNPTQKNEILQNLKDAAQGIKELKKSE